MNTTAKTRRRNIATALQTPRALRYATANGRLGHLVNTGHLIKVSTFLDRAGYDPEFIRRYASPFGKHVKQAARRPLVQVWALVGEHYRMVLVYTPTDPALTTAVRTYPRTRTLTAADFAECA